MAVLTGHARHRPAPAVRPRWLCPRGTTLHWFEIVLGVLLALKFPELALWMNHIVTPGHVEQDAAPVVTADVVGIPENPVA